MAKRWFIARMGDYENDGSRVPKVAIYPNVNYRLWSRPGFDFCLGQLASNNLDQFSADPDIKLIPDSGLDNELSSLPAAVKNAMQTQLQAGGFNISAVRNAWSVRQLLKHLKLQLQSDDNIESGDVPDVEG